ncbi:MAG: lipoyl(octanoyl) transferase LipB [Actinomycetota bacterium]|nr:lipoyl(octanoyl) transferase LipB [Actinomycetota bacterium]
MVNLGVVPYRDALDLQGRLRSARQADAIPDVLLCLEHEPVYTRGRRTEPGDLPMGESWYRSQGLDVADSDRGGRVTYHGPGQLVGYPIMRVREVPAYVHTMESAIVAALDDEGIEAQVREGLTGVWTAEAKIGSIGVHVSRGVTTHGFAVNVDGDLQPFEWIRPCGLDHVRMTSVLKETGRTGCMPGFRNRAATRFAEAFGRRPRLVSEERLWEGMVRCSPENDGSGARRRFVRAVLGRSAIGLRSSGDVPAALLPPPSGSAPPRAVPA